ncbi:MAG: hypothetical protein HDT39_00940 [Lachnospiraceae bacterium]|nr:hypothetical protein [Lachnospiraceae bacterium]
MKNKIVCIDDLINQNYKIYENGASMKLKLKCNKSGTLVGVLSYDNFKNYIYSKLVPFQNANKREEYCSCLRGV